MVQVQTQRAGEVAVVIGGSMAGLLTARILADHYPRVTILERDALPSSGEARKGVPQGRHAHALLARGQQILEELFPDLTQHLVEQGAAQGHGRFFSGGGYHHRVRLGAGGLFVSRPRLEAEIRARLLAQPNIHIADRCAVKGIVANEDRSRVIGVRVTRPLAASSEDVIAANLVVDASGRGSQAPAWLDALGYPKPEVDLMDVGMGYTTRTYRRHPDHLDGDAFINVAPSPAHARACGMLAQEGDRWIVTLGGYFGDHPPTDEVGFLAFARSLATPDIYDVIRTATPLSDPVSYRFPANQRRHYEKLDRFPDGFLVIGDAIASFTPIYGQGMTVAAAAALALRDCLATGTHQLARRFFRQAGRVVDIPWSITVGNDLRLSGARTGETLGPTARFFGWYMDRLHVAARHDQRVASAFLRVANLLDLPLALLHPRIAVRVLHNSLRPGQAARSERHVPAQLPIEGEARPSPVPAPASGPR